MGPETLGDGHRKGGEEGEGANMHSEKESFRKSRGRGKRDGGWVCA